MYIDSWECQYCNENNNYKYEPETIQNDSFVMIVKCENCEKENMIDVSVGITITSVITKEAYDRIFNKKITKEDRIKAKEELLI